MPPGPLPLVRRVAMSFRRAPMWSSSEVVSRGCGAPTTCCGSGRGSPCSCWRPSTSDMEPAGAMAAGYPRSSRSVATRLRGGMGWRRRGRCWVSCGIRSLKWAMSLPQRAFRGPALSVAERSTLRGGRHRWRGRAPAWLRTSVGAPSLSGSMRRPHGSDWRPPAWTAALGIRTVRACSLGPWSRGWPRPCGEPAA